MFVDFMRVGFVCIVVNLKGVWVWWDWWDMVQTVIFINREVSNLISILCPTVR